MSKQTITEEGVFTAGTRKIINDNFNELYADLTAPTPTTATTLTIDSTYAGSIVALARAAGTTVTLPAATGSGNVYRFVSTVSVSGGSTIIKVANASDIMGGVATMGSSGGTSLSTGTTTTSDTITFNGTTTGGLIGTYVELRDVAANIWKVEVHGVASGVAATPFSATV